MSYFTFKDHNIYYNVQGQGEPVLILNGIMMSTKSWDIFEETLSFNNMFIRVDFIDQGQSDKYKGQNQYTQDIQVELVKALLTELKLDKIHLVGISYGGEVAINFSAKYPDLVKRLVLFNTTANTSPWLADIGHSWNAIGKTRNGRNYYLATIPVIYSPKFYEDNIEWMRKREQILTPIFSNDTFLDAMERLTNSAEHYDMRNQLSEITANTLIIGANQDYLTPLENQIYLNNHIKHSELLIVPNAGHAFMYEKPSLFVSIILGHINAKTLNYSI